MTPKGDLTLLIKRNAHDFGFHHVGITSPDPPEHLDVYLNWLSSGHHADLAWMGTREARQRRADPRRILPECKSILCLGIHYSPAPSTKANSGEGQIASYAWGNDYHNVLPEKLKSLVTFIENQLGYSIPNRWYTDTGPLLEKELAQRSGIGWIGKNSNLINPKSGSYFFLAEILLGIELVHDLPFVTDHCGSCTRCIDACPTNCILPNRTIDAGRCISYLTIEHKGGIPVELRPKIGNWIFGCDICQQVCPWNQRFALSEVDSTFSSKFGGLPVSLKDELALDAQAFNQKFKGTPIKRTKRRGYLRNVTIALGNSADTDATLALSKSLKDHEPLVRRHAVWALGLIGNQLASDSLHSSLKSEHDKSVRDEIHQALASTKETTIIHEK